MKILSRRTIKCLTALTLALLVIGLSHQFISIVRGQDSVLNKIDSAHVAVSQAFEATTFAENSGANTSIVLLQLNSAATLVSEAKTAYSEGLTDQASAKADNALAIAIDAQRSIVVLKSEAIAEENRAFLQTLAIFATASIAAVLVSIFVWIRSDRRFKKNSVKLKLS